MSNGLKTALGAAPKFKDQDEKVQGAFKLIHDTSQTALKTVKDSYRKLQGERDTLAGLEISKRNELAKLKDKDPLYGAYKNAYYDSLDEVQLNMAAHVASMRSAAKVLKKSKDDIPVRIKEIEAKWKWNSQSVMRTAGTMIQRVFSAASEGLALVEKSEGEMKVNMAQASRQREKITPTQLSLFK